MKRVLFILLLAFAAFAASPAQARQAEKQEITAGDYTNTGVPMADRMREDGKIYVVVAIIAVIFAGIIAYAVNIDRKVSRLEKEIGTSRKVAENA
ncbi:CcmD family protein [Roseivirga sp. BDSF3-8]|uniref:CcmD family protein n=1 Tax=Roseivirga sp. BDSF3-8 TaxID=3241598 RepID=UPI0035319D49